jgi:hypothetical protein
MRRLPRVDADVLWGCDGAGGGAEEEGIVISRRERLMSVKKVP